MLLGQSDFEIDCEAMTDTVVTRFAPSPTGHLHLGHIYAGLVARRHADQHEGEMHLRIEDIDHTRCKPEFAEAIHDDLEFMGIEWDGVVIYQSQRLPLYRKALDQLKARDLVYPCYLTRRELDHLLSAPHGPAANTDQLIDKGLEEERRGNGEEPAWRLRMEAIRPLVSGLAWTDLYHGSAEIDLDSLGDEVIARKDIGTSYHLAVVVDDAIQGVTVVTRGADLIASTPLHRVLQEILGLRETRWMHHELVQNSDGERLAKRLNSLSIRSLRLDGLTREAILALLDSSPKG